MGLLQKTNTFSVLTPNKKESIDYDPFISSHTVLYPSKPINNFEKFLQEAAWGSIKGDILNQKDLLKLIQNITDSKKIEWGFIKGDLSNQQDLINYLIPQNLSYTNEYVKVNNIKEALDTINDKLFYKLPDPLNVSFTAEYFRKGIPVSMVYNGMIIDKAVYKWVINNWQEAIKEMYFNGALTTEYSHIELTPITVDTKVTLKVESDYVDSKGNFPKSYIGECLLHFNSKQFYWADIDGNITNISPKKQLMSDTQFNITTEQLEYIYLLFPSKKSWIHIYEQGSVDPGGVVTNYIGEVSYKEYDNPVTYHLYRSTNALKGKWTIKYQ